jgi:hypothetical protein
MVFRANCRFISLEFHGVLVAGQARAIPARLPAAEELAARRCTTLDRGQANRLPHQHPETAY